MIPFLLFTDLHHYVRLCEYAYEVACDVKTRIDPRPVSLGHDTRHSFFYILRPVKATILLEQMLQCVSKSSKNILGSGAL